MALLAGVSIRTDCEADIAGQQDHFMVSHSSPNIGDNMAIEM